MGDFPTAPVYDDISTAVTPRSLACLGDIGLMTAFSFASATGFTANTALFYPFRVQHEILVKKVGWHNGATASGNVDMGIYDSANNRVVSTGSTAQGTVSVWQFVDIADTALKPGYYWMGFVTSSGTATFSLQSTAAQVMRTWGVYQMASALPLPATSTPATVTVSVLPNIGLFLNSAV